MPRAHVLPKGRLLAKPKARMGLLVLQDPNAAHPTLTLVSSRLIDWVLGPIVAPIGQKEPIPHDVHDELLGSPSDPRLHFLVPVSSDRQNDRALLVQGKEFPSMQDVQRYAKRHRIDIYAQYQGRLY